MEKRELYIIRRQVTMAVNLLKGVANESRLLVLCHLCEGEKSVGELVEILGLSQSSLSQHLAYLRRQKIVKARKEETKVFYSVAEHPTKKLLKAVCGACE